MTENKVSPYMQQNIDRFVAHAEKLKKSFIDLTEVTINKVPRDIFYHHFLPLFSGQDYSRKEELLPIWYQIAGAANKPVDVVDSAGKVLVRVPPVQNNYLISPITKRVGGMHFETEQAKQYAQASPLQGEAMLNNSLNRTANAIATEEDQTEIYQQWLKVFEVFGIKQEQEEKKTSIEEEDDDLEY